MDYSLGVLLAVAVLAGALGAVAAAMLILRRGRGREHELAARAALQAEQLHAEALQRASLGERARDAEDTLAAANDKAQSLQRELNAAADDARRSAADTAHLRETLAELRRQQSAREAGLRGALATAADRITDQAEAHRTLMRGAEGLIAQKNAEIESLRERIVQRERRILQLEDMRAQRERRPTPPPPPAIPARRSVDLVPHSAAAVPLTRASAR